MPYWQLVPVLVREIRCKESRTVSTDSGPSEWLREHGVGLGEVRPQGLRLSRWTLRDSRGAVQCGPVARVRGKGPDRKLRHLTQELQGSLRHPHCGLFGATFAHCKAASSPKSHLREKSHDLGLYNLPVTEQLELRASGDESAARVASGTQVTQCPDPLLQAARSRSRAQGCGGHCMGRLGWASLGAAVPGSKYEEQVPGLLTLLPRALGQALAPLGKRRG